VYVRTKNNYLLPFSYFRGEFLEDRCTVANLTVQDLLKLKDEGYYVEPPPVKEVDDYYLLKAKMMTTNSKRQKEQVIELDSDSLNEFIRL
jgi:hypothetical protein